jgi:hypothetical protein
MKLESKFKDVYIYASVNIDNALNQILPRSKKVRDTLALNKLPADFIERLRKEKNFVSYI